MLKKKIKNTIGIGLLILGIKTIILAAGYITITGNVISETITNNSEIFSVVGVIFILGALVLFLSRQTLDAIIVPTGSTSEQDANRSEKARNNKNNLDNSGYFLISGYVPENKEGKRDYKNSQTYNIYKELRKGYDVKASQIRVDSDSNNSIENILNSFRKIKEKGGREIGIVSYPAHLKRFDYIIQKAKEEEIIDNDFRVHMIKTSDKNTWRERAYEFLAGIKNRYKLREGLQKKLKLKINKQKITSV